MRDPKLAHILVTCKVDPPAYQKYFCRISIFIMHQLQSTGYCQRANWSWKVFQNRPRDGHGWDTYRRSSFEKHCPNFVSISSHSLASFVGRWIDDISAIHRVFMWIVHVHVNRRWTWIDRIERYFTVCSRPKSIRMSCCEDKGYMWQWG